MPISSLFYPESLFYYLKRVKTWVQILSHYFGIPETVTQKCSGKKLFWNIFQNSQGNTCTWVSFIISLQVCSFYIEYLMGECVRSFIKKKTSKMPSQPAFTCFKVNHGNTRTMCEICSKLTIKTSERHQWRSSPFFIDNFEQILLIALTSLLFKLNK